MRKPVLPSSVDSARLEVHPEAWPKTTKLSPMESLPPFAPMIRSANPSPLTSPAVLTE